jgi:hypothetical protein
MLTVRTAGSFVGVFSGRGSCGVDGMCMCVVVRLLQFCCKYESKKG